MKGILYPGRLCLKVLEPCAKEIFKAGYYDRISQTVFTVRDFGEFAKALTIFASTPFRVCFQREGGGVFFN
jgi:hypothetical protein